MGRVAKPHGLKGEVIVELVTDRRERLDPGSRLHTEDGVLEVVTSKPHGGRHLVAFAGVGDRAAAEELHGRVLRAEPLEDPEALWVHELIGAAVTDVAGADLGSVQAVEANPASDLLVLDGGGLVPVRFVVDRAPGHVTVDVPAGLLD